MAVLQWISSFLDSFFSLMSTFRPQDFLDILLVAFIVYNGIKIIRETRAIQLLKGIILLAFIYLVVNILDMQAISYILDMIIKFGVVIIVILFQPEIRHALESIGRSSFNKLNIFATKNSDSFKQRERLTSAITQVCRACASMSEKKIGALIVFEKYTLLGEVINTGTIINAELTSQIVENIFYPKAPLHDGAMIVRDGKVFAAGCILPLTQNNSLDSELGTRHRAALGLSEQSDALVAVVSEETGAISIAVNGVITRNLSDGDLRIKLLQHILDDSDENEENIFTSAVKKAKQLIRKDKENESKEKKN